MTVPSDDESQAASVERVAGRYQILGPLGAGGMGTVVRVHDEATGRELALKRVRRQPGEVEDPAAQTSLQREYHTLRQLQHPHIVEVIDFGVDESGPYYTMELLSGSDLRDLAPVEFRRACRLLRDVASALALLHSRRLLHRDVSPRNVRCTEAGVPKLIDFGVLATIGVSMEVVGTPPFIPREALHGQPLDQRADIYGLGALGYWLLTGRHAYPVTTLVALEAAWRRVPEPPSTLAPDVPPALDELLLSMLKVDALARPSNVIEVIAKLEVIANLSPLGLEDTAQWYLTHPVMTGRAPALGVLRQRVRRTLQGHGGALIIEAPLGLGRTRLLQEAVVEGRIEGGLWLHAHARSSGSDAYGVVRALVTDLVASCPDDLAETARVHLPVLGHLFPAIWERLGGGSLPPLPQEPSELRARIQHTLRTWLNELADVRPLLIAVDDVHRADEPSAALLASLALDAESGSILILTTLRAGAEVEAHAAVRALREHSTRVTLTPLSPMATEHLVRSLFGAGPHLRRLSDWVHEMSGGNPLRAIELVRDLVARHVIRHDNGLWLLPADLSNEQPPRSLADAFAARVEALSEHARHVGEILAVYGERLPIELLLRVAGGDRAQSFRSLDELVMQQVLIGSAATYDFAQDGMRDAFLRGLSKSNRRAIHLSVGEALLARGVERAVRKVQAGYHLLHGGAELRGAELLVEATASLRQGGGILDLGPAFVGALQSALAVFERARRAPSERVILQIALARCAYLHDRHLVNHGWDALEQLALDSGLGDLSRVTRELPSEQRWQYAVQAAKQRYEDADPQDRGLPPLIAVPQLITVAFAVAGVALVCLDIEQMRRLCSLLSPWAELSDRHPGHAAHRILVAALDQLRGRDANAADARRAIRAFLQDGELFKRLPQEVVLHLRAASLHGVGMIEVLEGKHALERAQELEALDSRTHAAAAVQIRMLKSLYDGDTVRAEEYRERLEALSLEGGTSWRIDAQLPAYLALAYAASGDMLGLRRVVDQLGSIAESLPGFSPYLWLARGAYHRERGELEQSRQALLKSMELGPAGEHACWTKAVANYVQTLVVCRDHELARRTADEAVAQCERLGIAKERLCWSLAPWIATAEARVGDTVAATRRLESVLDAAQREQAAGVVLGRLHEARARVALLCADRTTFHEHLAATARYFASTRDPMLVAAHARLYEEGMRSGALTPASVAADTAPPPGPAEETRDLRTVVRDALGGATRPRERADRALQILLDNVGVTTGYLYLCRDTGNELGAPLHGLEPPEGLDDEVAKLVADRIAVDGRSSRPPRDQGHWTTPQGAAVRLLPLSTRVEDVRVTVAVLALSLRDGVFSPPSSLLLTAVADALVASGDVVPAFAADRLPR